jgi:hypothetical protein
MTNYADWLAYKRETGEAAVAAHIYNAMQTTYRTLRDYMQPRLKTGLMTKEKEYFNDIAKDAPKSPARGQVTAGQMEHVYSAAVQRNNKALAEKGWVG